MAMKLVKKTAEYTIYQRNDERYAVQDSNKKPVNGDEKVRILVTEELIKASLPAEPVAEEPAEEEAADEVEAAADEAPVEDEPAGEDAPAVEEAVEESPAEEAPAEDEEDK
jgi:hypothetical protein